MAPKGRPVFDPFLNTKIVPLSGVTYFLGSHFRYFVPFLITKIVPLSGETYFLGPNFGDFSKNVRFWPILGTRFLCFTTQRNDFHGYFGPIFEPPDGRTDADGRTHGRDQRTHIRFFGLSTQ